MSVRKFASSKWSESIFVCFSKKLADGIKPQDLCIMTIIYMPFYLFIYKHLWDLSEVVSNIEVHFPEEKLRMKVLCVHVITMKCVQCKCK